MTCDITISIWIPEENKSQETSFSRSYLRLWSGSLGFFPTYNSQFLMGNHVRVRVLGLREQLLKSWHLLFVPGKPSRILKRRVFGFLWIKPEPVRLGLRGENFPKTSKRAINRLMLPPCFSNLFQDSLTVRFFHVMYASQSNATAKTAEH